MHKGQTILKLTYEPSWAVDPKETYQIIQTTDGQYFGQYKRHKSLYGEKKDKKQHGSEIEVDLIEELLDAMKNLHIPVFQESECVCDGDYYSLKIGNSFGKSIFRWFCGIESEHPWWQLQQLAQLITAIVPAEPPEPACCPACGSQEIIPIVYGEPTEKTIQQAERGEIALGGCCQEIVTPNRKCKDCGYMWKQEGVRIKHVRVSTRFNVPFEFVGLPPEGYDPDRDKMIPPDELQVSGFVTFSRDQNKNWQMSSIIPVLRWAQKKPIYQVERSFNRYKLRQIPSGGMHWISMQAMRRIRGHGRTVCPSEAYGILIGWPEKREVLAALPVGRTHTFQDRADLFQDILYALPTANELASVRGLSVVGLYCTTLRCGDDLHDISIRIPAGLEDLYLVIASDIGSDWPFDMLTRTTRSHGRLPAPWRISHRRIDSPAINPRRIHSEWIKRFGPMDYGKCEPEETSDQTKDYGITPSSTPNWFSAPHMPVSPEELPEEWSWMPNAIEQENVIDIMYAGGSAPDATRTIRPIEIFRVQDYEHMYLRAIDTDINEERVFRLDRIESASPKTKIT